MIAKQVPAITGAKLMKNLREIAEIEGLEYFETTSQMNGYPSHIKGALKGFDDFEQAKEIAEKYDLSIECFTKKDGWQLWCRSGDWRHEPFKNSADDYGDNYMSYSSGTDEKEFYKDEVKPFLNDFETFEELEKFIKDRKEIYEEIERADDDEIVITNYGSYYETIKKESMYFYHDTNHYVIGLIDRND